VDEYHIQIKSQSNYKDFIQLKKILHQYLHLRPKLLNQKRIFKESLFFHLVFLRTQRMMN